jgi:hypothetical protein
MMSEVGGGVEAVSQWGMVISGAWMVMICENPREG